MEPRIQYAKASDGVSIAYWSLGEGGTPLVLLPPLAISHCSMEWRVPELAAWYHHLARDRMIVRYDLRGMGLSQRDAPDVSLEAHAGDVEAVADRLGLEEFDLASFFATGCPAIVCAAQNPDRVSRLLLWAVPVQIAPLIEGPRMQALLSLVERDWEIFTETIAHALVGWSRGSLAHEWAAFIRESLTPTEGVRMLSAIVDRDLLPLLPAVTASTLIIYSPKFPVVGDAAARQIASGLADARVVRVDDESIAPYESPSGRRAFDDFLGAGEVPMPSHATATNVLTILFTDLASSTALTQRLGDARAQELLRAHNVIVREALGAHGGSEIKHTGDGIMASFPTASGALDCAVAIQRAVAAQDDANLQVHVGLNAGEPVAEDSDLFGTAVQLARRICDQAQAAEILVSNVVRELAAGKGFLFADRGAAALKGFEDPVRLYEVRWRDES
jgi:class 3 adenylate cyclase